MTELLPEYLREITQLRDKVYKAPVKTIGSHQLKGPGVVGLSLE
jgi:hypothetical protein